MQGAMCLTTLLKNANIPHWFIIARFCPSRSNDSFVVSKQCQQIEAVEFTLPSVFPSKIHVRLIYKNRDFDYSNATPPDIKQLNGNPLTIRYRPFLHENTPSGKNCSNNYGPCNYFNIRTKSLETYRNCKSLEGLIISSYCSQYGSRLMKISRVSAHLQTIVYPQV